MNVRDFKQALVDHPESELLFQFSSGSTIPRHFHVTEIGRVTKDFIDCGGTRRMVETCVLQTLVADDVDHRIKAGKLADIFDKAGALAIGDELSVETEIQGETIGIYGLDGFSVQGNQIVFGLANKQTACLAPDQCGLESESPSLPVADSGNC